MVSRQTVEHAIGISILALIAVGSFLILRPFLSAIIWAAVLTYSTWPLFERLKNRLGGREGLAAAIMILAVSCILVVPIAVLAWSMADQVVRLAGVVRGWFEHGLPALPVWVADIPVFGGRLVQRWHDLFQTGDLNQNLSPYLATARAQLLVVASTAANGLLELLLSLFLAFFFYCNGPEISEALSSMGVSLTGERGRRLIAVVASTIRGVVKGLLGTNLIQAVLGAVGFWMAGVPGAMLLGFFVFFLTVIPFGAALVWVPAVLWVANTGSGGTAMLLAVWCVLIFGILENVARPFLVGRGSTLPSLLILLGMLGGMSAFGFLGVFLGPALLALVYTLIDEWRAPA
ncbi:MAG TPA: AI-2E family transporter [Pseudolabrys sp.]|jgi:predicted PurR-regulated permease PerM|nr:AI-2E family transporter [Pseudolabrys sp.]